MGRVTAWWRAITFSNPDTGVLEQASIDDFQNHDIAHDLANYSTLYEAQKWNLDFAQRSTERLEDSIQNLRNFGASMATLMIGFLRFTGGLQAQVATVAALLALLGTIYAMCAKMPRDKPGLPDAYSWPRIPNDGFNADESTEHQHAARIIYRTTAAHLDLHRIHAARINFAGGLLVVALVVIAASLFCPSGSGTPR